MQSRYFETSTALIAFTDVGVYAVDSVNRLVISTGRRAKERVLGKFRTVRRTRRCFCGPPDDFGLALQMEFATVRLGKVQSQRLQRSICCEQIDAVLRSGIGV